METVIGLSFKGMGKVNQFIGERLKQEQIDNYASNWEAWHKAILERVGDRVSGVHEPSYEFNGTETRSGNPAHLVFEDDDFIWTTNE